MTEEDWEKSLKNVNEDTKKWVDEEIFKAQYGVVKNIIQRKTQMNDKQPKPLTYEEMLEIAEQRERENEERENPDEFFLDNVNIHYEVMGDDAIWFSFTHPNGQIDHFNIVRKGKKLYTLYSCNTGNVKGINVEEPTIFPEYRH